MKIYRMTQNDAWMSDVEVGKRYLYEYHCWESDSSSDAQLWYRSHRPILVTGLMEKGCMDTPLERGNEGCPAVYNVRFDDGFEGDAFEDEILKSSKQYFRPDPPKGKI